MLNVMPISEDQFSPFQSQTYLKQSQDRIGPAYKKALYFEYTDDTFQTIIEKPSWLGFLGPIMKAETGDLICVHVKNFASRNYSFHPHGITCTKENEAWVTFKAVSSGGYCDHTAGCFLGTLYPDNTTGQQKEDDRLEPGAEYTYRWFIEETQGPCPNDSNCMTRMYHPHVETLKDVASGLLGPILTCKRGTLDRDMEKNIHESYAINGYMYGNLPNLTVCAEDRVKWYFVGMGGVLDTHSIFTHGQTLISRNHRKDTVTVFSASMQDAFLVAKGAGEWMLGCQIHEGMQTFFNVRSCQNPSTDVIGTQVLHYYIAAEEIFWNYAPSGIDFFTGNNLTAAGGESRLYFEQGPNRTGGIYKKLVYLEYTDASFQTQKAKANHLGLLGPVIKAETPSPSSYVNASTTYVYTWQVPTDVGPTSTDPDCLTWLYYSSTSTMALQGLSSCAEMEVLERMANSVGSSKDLHGIYFSRNTFTSLGARDDTIALFPHTSQFMIPDSTGKLWIFSISQKYVQSPIIFLSLGEKLYTVFKNSASRPYSIHAHGMKTNYSTVVPTQQSRTYIWQIPERAGPTSKDFECIPWFYYSTVDVVRDLNSRLVGPLIVYRKDTKASIVHRVLHFMIFNENESWYSEENINTYSQESNQVDRSDATLDLSNQIHDTKASIVYRVLHFMIFNENESWYFEENINTYSQESNQVDRTINGRMFGNNQGLTFHVRDEVDWYLIGMGGEFDLHTVHFHGHSFQYTVKLKYSSNDAAAGLYSLEHLGTAEQPPGDSGEYHSDVYDLPPGIYQTVEMYPRDVGIWLFHCHINVHIGAGMESTYTVIE
ncbi:hypothetical protein E2I00_007451 [Balaenoptera physalus]|uniref:ferroxidase n=1 Tax=Balaenoptera physalus TaxID=9770 RepID=A0A6A1Q200_BALPH|nr:hypothetical protein E2I00_007451 [Balaenoptera physalus]